MEGGILQLQIPRSLKPHACQEQKSPGSQLTEATSSTSETEAERDHSRAGSLEASAESAEVFFWLLVSSVVKHEYPVLPPVFWGVFVCL